MGKGDKREEVSAAELVRHFALYREEASIAPLRVTHHGRRTHVLLGEDLYRNILTSHIPGDRTGGALGDQDLLYNLADWIDEGLIICGPDFDVRFANRVALAICCRRTQPLPAVSLFEALPEIAGSLMEVHLRRTMIGGEPSAADLPSPFAKDSWLRFQSFPLGEGTALKFRDITDDVRSHRLADTKEAILKAMDVHGEVAYVRLSVRGTIDKTSMPFCEMVELSADRLDAVAIGDLVEIPRRAEFRKVLESVLRGNGPERLQTSLMANSGRSVPVTASIVQLHGAYGAEGAIVLMSPAEDSD